METLLGCNPPDPHTVLYNVQSESYSLSSLCHRPLSPDVAQTEERVGQRLLDMEGQKKKRENELECVEEQLRQYTAKSQITDSELQYLLRVCCDGESRVCSCMSRNELFLA